jgi:hypothetical protein
VPDKVQYARVTVEDLMLLIHKDSVDARAAPVELILVVPVYV